MDGKIDEKSLINPKQLWHYHVNVQDNPTSHRPLSIITDDGCFPINLRRKGTIVYLNSNTPLQKELEYLPHKHLSS